MKKLLVLFAAAFLLINCSDTKNSDSEKTDKDSTGEKTKKPDVKKPDTTGKVILAEHFSEIKPENLTKEDKSGWPEERKEEVLKMCLANVGDDGKEAKAYCNCQLDNAMKIFASYKEAMTTFNKAEDDLSEDEITKLLQMEETDNSCMEQNYREEEMEDEKDGM